MNILNNLKINVAKKKLSRLERKYSKNNWNIFLNFSSKNLS